MSREHELETRVRDLESRLARIEARVSGVENKTSLTTDETAEYLRISRTTIYELLNDAPENAKFDAALLACSYMVGHRRRFDPARLEAYRNERADSLRTRRRAG